LPRIWDGTSPQATRPFRSAYGSRIQPSAQPSPPAQDHSGRGGAPTPWAPRAHRGPCCARRSRATRSRRCVSSLSRASNFLSSAIHRSCVSVETSLHNGSEVGSNKSVVNLPAATTAGRRRAPAPGSRTAAAPEATLRRGRRHHSHHKFEKHALTPTRAYRVGLRARLKGHRGDTLGAIPPRADRKNPNGKF
jgi:hypothetical protein